MFWIHVLASLLVVSSVYGAPALTTPAADGSTIASIPENTATGTSVFTVLPTTPGWTYSMTPTADPFTINTGGTVQVSGALDFDTAPTSYTLTISVLDGTDPTPTVRTLTVQLTNTFDETPVFGGTSIVTINEGQSVGTTLAVGFTVTDADPATDTLTYSLQGPDASYFNIDPSTGIITIAKVIDYDTGVTSLSFTVQVEDSGGNISTQGITVTVSDINDNTPIPENTGTGAKPISYPYFIFLLKILF